MSDKLYFTIDWKARRKGFSSDANPINDDKREIIESSLLVVESLVYVLKEASINSEKILDDKFALFNNVADVIDGFIASALSNLSELDRHRLDLQRIASDKKTK